MCYVTLRTLILITWLPTPSMVRIPLTKSLSLIRCHLSPNLNTNVAVLPGGRVNLVPLMLPPDAVSRLTVVPVAFSRTEVLETFNVVPPTFAIVILTTAPLLALNTTY
jgi:hypothetical protein